MPQSRLLYVGWDVHQASIAVASVAQDHGAEVVSLGTVGTRQGDLDHRLRQRHSKATHLVVVYDAGPCGSWLYRDLTKTGHAWWGVAPAFIPKTAGDRVNTDRRDARHLARLMRAGDLTPVYVPQVDDEARRALSRAREDRLRDLNAAQSRRNAFRLRPDLRDTGQAHGRPAHRRWLAEVVGPTPAPQLVFHEDGRAVTAHTARLQRLEQALQERGTTWRLAPVVEALQAWRGVQFSVAVTTVAELGDRTRVTTPQPLRRDLGLTPAESSSGPRRSQGGLTTTGHRPARRALVEGAGAYR